jgi:hypothetical protein
MWLIEALAFGGAIVSTVAAIVQTRRVIGNLRARTALADHILAHSQKAERMTDLARGLHQNPVDPKNLERARKLLERHLGDLSPEYRGYVREALTQASMRGRAGYMARILEKSAEHKNQETKKSLAAR